MIVCLAFVERARSPLGLWLVIGSMALTALALVGWFAARGRRESVPVIPEAQQVSRHVTVRPDVAHATEFRRDRSGVVNTTILPHPDDAPLALLEFDDASATVAVRSPENIIGRHTSVDIRIPDVRVSRRHAKLSSRPGGEFEIRNLTADRPEPNPMRINGDHVEHARLRDGDVVDLGGVIFRFKQAAIGLRTGASRSERHP